MIITKILGGLGNQLFQYAAGKALALQNNTELKLDLTGFDNYKLRDFELDRFNVSYLIASEQEINKYKAVTSFQRIKARFSPSPKAHFYKQPFFHFDKSFYLLHSPVYLQGYFQSEKYFTRVEEKLRDELTLMEAVPPAVISMAKKLAAENSISVHLRRGDYSDAESLRVHGVLDEVYYRQALDCIAQKTTEQSRLYIFSDDAVAAKKLQLPNAEIVSGNFTQNHYEDFYLMQHCQHNIIANSSFSWWAAWLNNYPDKIVIAPKQWFGKTGPKDTQDLFPESWIRL